MGNFNEEMKVTKKMMLEMLANGEMVIGDKLFDGK